jgi:hypothetical protein
MGMLSTLRRSGAIDALARKLGLTPPVAATAVGSALPVLVGAMRRYLAREVNATNGVANLAKLLESTGGGAMAVAALAPGEVDARAGQRLLIAFFGDESQINQIAERCARDVGIAEDVAGRLLALLMMQVGGYVSARMLAIDMEGGDLVSRTFELLENAVPATTAERGEV